MKYDIQGCIFTMCGNFTYFWEHGISGSNLIAMEKNQCSLSFIG
jgi:hypothetical protein